MAIGTHSIPSLASVSRALIDQNAQSPNHPPITAPTAPATPGSPYRDGPERDRRANDSASKQKSERTAGYKEYLDSLTGSTHFRAAVLGQSPTTSAHAPIVTTLYSVKFKRQWTAVSFPCSGAQPVH
jgi:hypothetical protein